MRRALPIAMTTLLTTATIATVATTADAAPPLPVLAAPWIGPYGGVPAFDKASPALLAPAMEAGMAQQLAELQAIADDPAPPTFENTIAAMERSGRALSRAYTVYGIYGATLSDDAVQAVERDLEPKLAAFRDRITQNETLFQRIAAVYEARATSGLTPEQQRLTWLTYTDFVRAGAKLDPTAKQRLAAINQSLAGLFTRFSQNLLADEGRRYTLLAAEADLAGIPESLREGYAADAERRGQKGKWVVSNTRSSVEPFLTYSTRRDLREKVWREFVGRGDNGDARDNNAIIGEILQLRAERARLLGHATHAHWRLENTMARTPERAMALMEAVWKPAVARVREEVADMQRVADAEGAKITIEPWDYRYYAEKVRKSRFDLDQDQLKPYFQLDKMLEAQFFVAGELWGLKFAPRTDLPVYHPDVRIWEVRERDGRFIGLFYGDFYSRPSKQSGAWMSSYRNQRKLGGVRTPVVVNVCNFNKPAAGQPALLSYDDAETLFHEFGHALHGLLSDVTFPRVAGTSVPTDFVELPAQIYEHWLGQAAILRRFAVHHQTGEPIPQALLDRLMAARNFNQGFATVEFLSSAFVDLDVHMLTGVDAATFDIDAAERDTLARLQMPAEIVCRHRPTHFGHIFSGGYSAGYYSYMWSEVLDADGFEAFKEAGDIFDKATAARLRQHVYSAGGTRDPMELYVAFRGREPDVQALLRNRGFA